MKILLHFHCDCPAFIFPAPPDVIRRLCRYARRLFPLHSWAPAQLLFDLGPMLGLRNGPRDPGLVAELAGFVALDLGGLAGPLEVSAAASALHHSF